MSMSSNTATYANLATYNAVKKLGNRRISNAWLLFAAGIAVLVLINGQWGPPMDTTAASTSLMSP